MSLQIEHITHTFSTKGLDTRTVIKDTGQITLAAGEQLLLRGISGSGKTTLLNIIAGLLRPTGGDVTLNGESLYTLSEAKRDRFRTQHIGYVFQTHNLLPMLTAAENVMMPLAFAGEPLNQRRERAMQLLQELDMVEFADYPPVKLSTGQRARVAVARALANRPMVVLADEPTAALDGASGKLVVDLLQETCTQNKTILMVSSHDPQLFSRFPRILDLKNGRMTEIAGNKSVMSS